MARIDFPERILALLFALCFAVRFLSFEQVARQWWRGDRANMRRSLRPLVSSGLLCSTTVLSRSLPALEAPVSVWSPGEPAPEFGKIAYRLKRRWSGRAPKRTAIYLATARAARLLGGRASGRVKNRTQAQHDLALAEVYLWFLNQEPELADCWRGEDHFLSEQRRRREKLPDACLVDPNGLPFLLIEQGGGYDKARVREFHAYAQGKNLPYELW